MTTNRYPSGQGSDPLSDLSDMTRFIGLPSWGLPPTERGCPVKVSLLMFSFQLSGKYGANNDDYTGTLR